MSDRDVEWAYGDEPEMIRVVEDVCKLKIRMEVIESQNVFDSETVFLGAEAETRTGLCALVDSLDGVAMSPFRAGGWRVYEDSRGVVAEGWAL